MFYGSGTATGNTEPGRQAIEVMESDDADAPRAYITTWLTEEGFGAPGLPNALVNPNAAVVEPVVLVNSVGNVGIGTTEPTALLDINSDILRLRTAKTPATAAAAGNVGDICWDANYLYICVAASSWKRAAITTW